MSAAKQEKQKRTSRARLLAVVIVAALSSLAALVVYLGASGSAFDLSRRSTSPDMPRSGRLAGGVMPFVADQVLYFPIAVALLAMIAIYLLNYLNSPGRQFWIAFTSGAAALITVCLVSLALEITWVATGVPYTNYSGSYSAWTDPSRYFWPILALSLCLIAAFIAGAVGIWALRSTSKSRKTRSVSKARKVGTASSRT